MMLEAVVSRESHRRRFYPGCGWKEREDMADFVYDLSGEDA
ncbi:MAG: hypothetical protein ACYCX5_10005 [Coriobacteriia bacterium]